MALSYLCSGLLCKLLANFSGLLLGGQKFQRQPNTSSNKKIKTWRAPCSVPFSRWGAIDPDFVSFPPRHRGIDRAFSQASAKASQHFLPVRIREDRFIGKHPEINLIARISHLPRTTARRTKTRRRNFHPARGDFFAHFPPTNGGIAFRVMFYEFNKRS